MNTFKKALILSILAAPALFVLMTTAEANPNQPGEPVEYKVDVTVKWNGESIDTGSIDWTDEDDSVTIDVPAGAVVSAVADSRDEDNVWDGSYHRQGPV